MIAPIRDVRRTTERPVRAWRPASRAAEPVGWRCPPPPGQDARVRRVLGIRLGGALPKVSAAAMVRYHAYLAENLAFPFRAEFFDEREGGVCDHSVTATRLVGSGEQARVASRGIDCEILVWGGPVTVRLAELRPDPQTANRQLIDDYRYWLRSRQ